MATKRSPDPNPESMMANGKARAAGRGQVAGYAAGGRVPKAEMEKREGSAADRREDMVGARRMMKRGKLARGGKAGC